MQVTILADASHCPETLVAGYGYWTVSSRGRNGGSGVLNGTVLTSTIAELMAVANAIYHAAKSGILCKRDELLIQTDCESAIFAFTGRRRVSNDERRVVKYVTDLIRKMELQVSYKHIRAHTANPESRFLALNRCDRDARKRMRSARNKVISQKEESNGTNQSA